MFHIFCWCCCYKCVTSYCSADDANLSQLEAFHEEHLADEIDLLEEHLSKIREQHHLLADQLRSKFV